MPHVCLFFLWNQIWIYIFVRNSKLARVHFFACSVVVASAVVFVNRVKQQHIADTCSRVTIYCFISSLRRTKCKYSKKKYINLEFICPAITATSGWINLHINVLFLIMCLFIYDGCSHVLLVFIDFECNLHYAAKGRHFWILLRNCKMTIKNSILFYSALTLPGSLCASASSGAAAVLQGCGRRRGRSDGAPVHGPPSASCSVFWRRLRRALPTPIDQTFSWMFSSNSRLLQTRGTWRD